MPFRFLVVAVRRALDGVRRNRLGVVRLSMPPLHLRGRDVVEIARAAFRRLAGRSLDEVHDAVRVTVWNDEVAAFDMGAVAAQWFSDFLGQPLRLVRFDPAQQRLASAQWCAPVAAEAAFADEFPLLVTSQASLDELNRRLGAGGAAPVTMQRFRPNLVLDGLGAHDEDHIDELRFDTPDGPVRLRLVKPCSRCSIPDIDPLSAERGHTVGDTLAGYRADARLDGAITFGMNAVIVEGTDRTLRTGLAGGATYRF